MSRTAEVFKTNSHIDSNKPMKAAQRLSPFALRQGCFIKDQKLPLLGYLQILPRIPSQSSTAGFEIQTSTWGCASEWLPLSRSRLSADELLLGSVFMQLQLPFGSTLKGPSGGRVDHRHSANMTQLLGTSSLEICFAFSQTGLPIFWDSFNNRLAISSSCSFALFVAICHLGAASTSLRWWEGGGGAS